MSTSQPQARVELLERAARCVRALVEAIEGRSPVPPSDLLYAARELLADLQAVR